VRTEYEAHKSSMETELADLRRSVSDSQETSQVSIVMVTSR